MASQEKKLAAKVAAKVANLFRAHVPKCKKLLYELVLMVFPKLN